MNGRKRHLLVDTTMGLVLKAVVHTADVADRDGARRVMGGLREQYPRMQLVWCDRGYNGALAGWMQEEKLGWALKIVKPPRRWVRVPEGKEPPPYPKGFIVLPRR